MVDNAEASEKDNRELAAEIVSALPESHPALTELLEKLGTTRKVFDWFLTRELTVFFNNPGEFPTSIDEVPNETMEEVLIKIEAGTTDSSDKKRPVIPEEIRTKYREIVGKL